MHTRQSLLPQMSPLDAIRHVCGEEIPRVGSHHVLRGKVTLDYAVQKSGLDRAKFAEIYLYRNRSNSRLMEKWDTGKATLFRNSAKALDKRLTGTLAVFDLPLFELLADLPLAEKKIASLLRPYRPPDSPYRSSAWIFPDHEAKITDETFVHIAVPWDTGSLRMYGTLESFCVILGVMRAAESARDLATHLMACQDLFRALPIVLRQPYFALHAKALGKQLIRIRNRIPYSRLFFDVNWRLIRRQARDPNYHPFRHRWPRGPDGRFIEPEDPVLPAEFIPGRRCLNENRGPAGSI